ncbi:MAG: endo-1,4-beta-xylanase, partial [Solirubrobacterales bacterium]
MAIRRGPGGAGLVLAFLAVWGGAPAHAAADVVVQGESLVKPAGATAVSNSAASGGRALFLTTTGTATGQVSTAATTGRVVLRAYGVQCSGPPRAVIKVDGRTVLVTFVPATSWTDYLADVSLPAGTHTLAVTYANDDATSTCNRGLLVDSLKLVNAANVTAPFRSPPLLGAAVRWSRLSTDATYQRTVTGNFDSITPENEMKMRSLEPQQGVFSFGVADAIVNWAQANGKAIRGHTLVWAPALPTWLKNGTWTPAQLNSILKQYIQTVVARYRGRIGVW